MTRRKNEHQEGTTTGTSTTATTNAAVRQREKDEQDVKRKPPGRENSTTSSGTVECEEMSDTSSGREMWMICPKVAVPLDIRDGGEMGRRVLEHPWHETPFGPIHTWPVELLNTIKSTFTQRIPIVFFWGPDSRLLYNDAYIQLMGPKHPALGIPASELWNELWDDLGPEVDLAYTKGQTGYSEDRYFPMTRHGYVEETYYNYSVSPILVSKTSAKESLPMSLADSYIGGVLGVCVEVTEKVIHERRERTVRELGGRAGSATSVSDACRIAGQVFEKNPWDLPFSLVYLVEGKKTKMATLQGSSGFKLPHPAAPPAIPLGELSAQYPTTPFPIHQVLSTGKIMTSSLTSASAATYFTPPFTSSVWPELPDTAVSLPIRSSFGDIVGCLVIGVSPRRRIDKSYRSFQELVARQLGNNLNSARASEEEKEKLRIMEELDKAKTDFFSSVSHEFRTPITLILGPVEEMLSTVTGEHAGKMKEIGVDVERMQSELRMVRRNALRLSKLVTSLLDFSRLEAGRMQARYARTDLAPFVKDLCGVFRSAVERAGLRFVVDVDAYALASPSVTSDKRDLNPASSHYAYVDRDMFEKIVYNLLSNALKNTLKGEIRVTLIRRGGAGTGGSGESSASSDTASIDAEEYAVLIIEDTGVGIAPQDLPRIFERFYRAEHSSRRSIEGTGIGLPLTRELVKMHGGKVRVTSEIDKGTRFEVKIPLGWGHLRRECVTEEEESSGVGDLYVEEAMGWMSEIGDKASPMGSHPVTHGSTDSLPPWNETGKGAGVSSETVVASADSHDGGTSETNVPITPITLDPTLPVTWSLTGAHAHRSTNPYILICDDNPDMASYLKSLFSPHFPLHICRNGLEAFQAAKHRPPGLILSDVMMPVMNGFELIRRIRNDPDLQLIPVILLSARAGEEARVEGLMHGADDYLAKPFGAKELVARVRTHLELGRLRNDLENLARLSPVGVFRLSREGIVYRSRRLVEISGVAMKFQKNMRGRTLPHGDESFEWDSDVLSVDGVHEEDKEKIRDAIKRTFETGEGDKVAYRYVKRRPGRAAIEGAHSPSSPSTQPGRPTSPNGDPNESGAEEDDAEVVHVIAEWHPEFDLHNRVVGLIGAVTDITDQVLSQRRQLADAEEMRKSQEALIDMISHEIRNPINAIYNNVDLLRHGLEARRKRAKEFFTWLEKRVFAPHKLEEGEGKPSMGTVITAQDEQYFREVYQELHSLHSYDAEALQAIEACAKHQRVIADDVLHLSKLKSGSISIFKRVFKPRELVDGVSAMFKAEMDRKGIEFRVEVRGMGEGGVLAEDDGVWGDPDRLGQVLINLLSNAVKFTEKRPKRCITLSLTTLQVHEAPTRPGIPRRTSATSSHSVRSTSSLPSPEPSDHPSHGIQKAAPTPPVDIILSVHDTGIGMSPYQLSKLFKRFSQASIRTHREYGGSGLGLHISKQMARLMDGDIWVESTEGVGSRFWVKVRCEKFPGFSAETEMATNSMEIGSPFFNTSAATIAARRMTTPPPPPTTTGGGGASSSASPASPSTYLKPDPNADRPIHILVAEDNIINQRVIKRQFEICEPRFLVTLASNGLEALEVVQKSGTAAKPISSNQEGAGDRHGHARGPVDVILMDVEMPVMDGMEATTKIRLFEQTLADSSSDVGVPVKRMPIIGLSGNAREEHRRRALEAGMDDYVVKPYERSSLVRKILEWVGR